jgi:hypothetical protein
MSVSHATVLLEFVAEIGLPDVIGTVDCFLDEVKVSNYGREVVQCLNLRCIIGIINELRSKL